MVRTQIQLPEAQAEAIRRIAADKHVSMAEIVRQGVELYLRNASMPRPDTMRQRALTAAGAFHSGHQATSRDHDRVLAEAFLE